MRRLPLALLAATAFAATALPASATGTAVVSGEGMFSPGLLHIPFPGHVRFRVAGTAVTTAGTGPIWCDVELYESVGSYAGGVAPTGRATCSGAVVVYSAACTSQRGGMTLTLACQGDTFGGTFHFTPRTVNPISTYSVDGQMSFA